MIAYRDGIRACTADYSSATQAAYEPHDERAALCPTPNHALVEASIRMSHSTAGNDDGFAVQDVLSAGQQIVNYFRSQKPSCVENALVFGYSQSAVVGVFAGAEVHQHGVTTNVLNKLLDYVEKNSVSETTVVQLCQADGRGADYGIGIIVSSAKHLPVVQDAVKAWVKGRCVSAADGDEDWMTVTLRVPARVKSNSDAMGNMTLPTAAAHLGSRSRIVARGGVPDNRGQSWRWLLGFGRPVQDHRRQVERVQSPSKLLQYPCCRREGLLLFRHLA
jgi:hypothetical protein